MNNNQFVAGIFLAIALAKLAPSIGSTGGILKPEITVKYIAVSSIFVISGLTLPTDELKSASLQWDLHLFIQGFTFVVFPALMYCLVPVLRYVFLHEGILQGMRILSYMPPPVSSAIILTKAVGGNEAGAVFNSVLGSVMGIFITPSLILMSYGSSIPCEVDTTKIFIQLLSTCLLPLVLGQLFRNYNYEWLISQSIPYKTIGNGLILFIIYTTFCSTFSRDDISIDIQSLVVTIVIIFFVMVGSQLLLKKIAQLQRFTPEDIIAIIYVASHKNIVIGIPVIEIIFNNDPNIIFYSIPLLVYNPLQIVLGGMSIPLFHQWLLEIRRTRRLQKRWYRANANRRVSQVW